MHVVISLLNFRQGKIGGTETYLRKLIPELVRQRADDRITLLAYRENASEILPAGATIAVLPWSEKQVTRLRILESFSPFHAREAERMIRSLRPDALFFPQQSLFPKRVPGHVVMTVHDFQYYVLPGNHSIADRAFRAGIYPHSLRRADRLLTISEYTRTQLSELYPGLEKKASVALLGYNAPTITRDVVSDVPQPYIYYPAVSLVHKNHRQLFNSIAALLKRGEFPYSLVLSGIQTPYWKKLERQVAQLGLTNVVRHVGYVSYARVQALYRDAEAVVFPTTYEGFGLPVVEAVSAGKPVIVSRLDIFRELGVPDQWCIDFSDADQLATALRRSGPTILEKPPPSWEQCAAQTWKALREDQVGGF